MEGLRGLVDGDHYFDTIAEDAFFEFRYHFPGWPLTIRGRDNLMASFSGYGKTIKLHSGDALVVQRSRDSRVVILEYEAHGFSVWCSRLRYGITRSNRRIFVVQPSQFPKQKEPLHIRPAVPQFLHSLFQLFVGSEWLLRPNGSLSFVQPHPRDQCGQVLFGRPH